MIHLKIFERNAGRPLNDRGDNDFSCFDDFSDHAGVYVFQCENSGKTLYVGESYSGRLKKRISQHYGETNTGGNFRINWCKTNCRSFCGTCKNGQKQDNKLQCNGEDTSSYDNFKRLVRESKLIVFSFGTGNEGGEVCADTQRKISAFEKFLILTLGPKWNVP